MTTKEACKFFGGAKALADLLDCWPQTIYSWGSRPPRGRQYEIFYKSKGKLRVDEEEEV